MRQLHVAVKNKIATYDTRDGAIVCSNSDYQIVFTFDSEWNNYATKTARFVWNGNYTDVVFTDTTCAVPVLVNTTLLAVGVYSGELHTTTPAMIGCKKSILCSDPVHVDPTPDVYDQIMELLNSMPLASVVGEAGTATDKVMHQKAVTDALAAKQDKLTPPADGIAYAYEMPYFSPRHGASVVRWKQMWEQIPPQQPDGTYGDGAYSLPVRTADQRLKAANATEDDDLVNLSQFNAGKHTAGKGIDIGGDNKIAVDVGVPYLPDLSIFKDTGHKAIIGKKDSSGKVNYSILSVWTTPGANSIAAYDSGGRLQTNAPTSAKHVTNKEYVDGKVWTPKTAEIHIYDIPATAEKLTSNSTGTNLYRMTKANFLAANAGFSQGCYDRILANGLVIQNYGYGADFQNNLAVYAPAFVETGMRYNPDSFTADLLYSRMTEHDIMLAFFPNYETGHETDIYFIDYAYIGSFIIY